MDVSRPPRPGDLVVHLLFQRRRIGVVLAVNKEHTGVEIIWGSKVELSSYAYVKVVGRTA